MDSTNIIIPFDFPFAILEHRDHLDPNNKLVYAVADGQFTYGPLSLYQYHNDEKYSKTIRDEELPTSLPCKEFYIINSDLSIDDAIEIIDNNRGRILVKEIDEKPQQIHMKELMHEMTECRNEIRSLKSLVLSADRLTRRSSSKEPKSKLIRNGIGCNRSLNLGPDNDGMLTPLHSKNSSDIRKSHQVQRSASTNKALLQNVKSSGYGQYPSTKQQIPAFATPTRSFRK